MTATELAALEALVPKLAKSKTRKALISEIAASLLARRVDLDDRDACFEACWNYIADRPHIASRVDLDTGSGWKVRLIIAAARREARR